jgi:hypothetical protein
MKKLILSAAMASMFVVKANAGLWTWTYSGYGYNANSANASLVINTSSGSVPISLPDIGTFASYEDYNTSDTFTGTGFLGIYPPAEGAPAFAHLFGLENYGYIYSETELQAPISQFLNTTIVSAYLDFSLVDGDGTTPVTVTSFTTTGTLGYNTSAPNNLGSLVAPGITLGANSINVTTLVQNAINADQNYLGLYLTPTGTAAVPDAASTMALLGAVVSGFAALKRKNQ